MDGRYPRQVIHFRCIPTAASATYNLSDLKLIHRSIVLVLLGLMLSSPAAGHDIPILDFTGGDAGIAGGPAVIGWEFSVSSTIIIDGLGFWDESGDGLNTSHDVGLWNGDGTTLLATATVDNSSSPNGFWLFAGISPVLLVPGNYVVAATVSNFDMIRNSLNFPLAITTIPEVSYIEARYLGAVVTLEYPPSAFVIDSFGPNLRLLSSGGGAAIPALGPSGIGALTLILGMVGAMKVRSLRMQLAASASATGVTRHY